MVKKILFSSLFVLLMIILALMLVFPFKSENPLPLPLSFDESHHQYVLAQGHVLLGFDLVDPEQAPPDILDSVMRGYSIIMNTPFYAPKYARDQLSCTNCHFFGGDTLGGRGNGLSLIGVPTKYPHFSEREKRILSLEERINLCFERSLSGNPMPIHSESMQDIINYLKWISKEVKDAKDFPWLGVAPLKSTHKADAEEGAKIYHTYCRLCHKEDGQGGAVLYSTEGKTIPPLWGKNSFNDAAGMSRIDTLAAFIYKNMPQDNEVLTEDQALDVAAFVLQQPRPHYKSN